MKHTITLLLLVALSILAPAQSDVQLIPRPVSMVPTKGDFKINSATRILHDAVCTFEARQLQSFLEINCGLKLQTELLVDNVGDNVILLSTFTPDPGLRLPTIVNDLPGSLKGSIAVEERENYRLNISPNAVVIKGQTTAGVAHAVQTLKQMTPSARVRDELLPISWPCMMIQDRPAFAHRGLLLDCCRHFMTVDFIKKYIDLLAYYKMNVLHWHLTEDQGWRIEIKKYPKLTEVGAYRTEADGSTYGGFYTQEQIKDIVKYAQDRHVTIIPEIELPGHSVAALASYPHLGCTHSKIEVENEWGVFKDIYCAGNDQTITFLKDVLTEVCALFPGPYIHIGGDEAPKTRWEECERCQKRIQDHHLKDEAELQTWLIEEMAAFLSTKNKQIIGWDEILEGGIPANAAIQSWRGPEGGIAAAKSQHVAIMSPTSHCYFDYGLQSIDLEKVYQFDPVPSSLTKAEAQFIRGGECNMWTEHAPQELVDSKVFPRLLAMSEVLWTYPGVRDYAAFNKRVEFHYPRLTQMGVAFGLPKKPIDVKIERTTDGKMQIVAVSNVTNGRIFFSEYQGIGSAFTLEKNRIDVTPYDIPVPQIEDYYKPIQPGNSAQLDLIPFYQNRAYFDQSLKIRIEQHLGYGKKTTRNFVTNTYYPGGGDQTFSDGLCYSSGFRDGFWQGVVQKELEITVDLEKIETIQFCNSHWYHYANAWILRPESVVYYGSTDGQTWFELGKFEAAISADDKREMPLLYPIWFKPQQARYVKMKVIGIGACPSWHDAAGEPSWLFGDELIVR
jgi:hexosaminidase